MRESFIMIAATVLYFAIAIPVAIRGSGPTSDGTSTSGGRMISASEERDMDKDQLAALDRAATQAEAEYEAAPIGQGNLHKLVTARVNFHAALVNAYRTGQLVLIDDGAVERMSAVIEQSMWSPASGPVNWTAETIEATKAQARVAARAALSALGAK